MASVKSLVFQVSADIEKGEVMAASSLHRRLLERRLLRHRRDRNCSSVTPSRSRAQNQPDARGLGIATCVRHRQGTGNRLETEPDRQLEFVRQSPALQSWY